ncbi:hypothetical protein [Comamonas testosteroni]|uniref:hypothetical protein n=1 Tax=Comamonas testosteroni TaxID=285 RepID=UPI0012D2D92E|nr:hypothetical protein [Comamonas testosteroni]
MWFRKLQNTIKTANRNFVCAAEAAFVGNVSQTTLYRVAEEGLIPARLREVICGEDRFRRFAGVLAHLNLELEDVLSTRCRHRVLAAIYVRAMAHPYQDEILDLKCIPSGIDWQIPVLDFVAVNPSRYLSQALERTAKIESAATKVVLRNTDGEDAFFFRKTNIPVVAIVNLLNEAQDVTHMRAIFPELTAEHVWVAHLYRQMFGSTSPRGMKSSAV